MLELKNVSKIYNPGTVTELCLFDNFNLTVNEDGLAFLYKNSEPKLLLEFRRPELVMACNEYLYHIAEQTGYSGIHKTKVIYRLQDIIKELGNVKVGEIV